MTAKIGVVIALAIFGYIALNGFFMLCSPVRWAGALWTAKGAYQDSERRERLSVGSERGKVRFAGAVMFLLSCYAFAVILGAFLG
jgi:hypothetical protein